MKRISCIVVTAAAIALGGLLSSRAEAGGPGYGNDRRPFVGYAGGYYSYAPYGYGYGAYGASVGNFPPNIALVSPNVALYSGYGGYGGYGGFGGYGAPGCGCSNYLPYGAGYGGGYQGYSQYRRW